jgi:hypothetical protein
VDEDFSIEPNRMGNESVPNLKDAKMWGHEAFLRKHILMENGQTYDLSYLRENIQLEAKKRQLDTPRGPRTCHDRGQEIWKCLNRTRYHGQRIVSWQQFGAGALTQGRQSTGHGTASQCPPSAQNNDDVNATMQTYRQTDRQRLARNAEPAGRKRKENRPRIGSRRNLTM